MRLPSFSSTLAVPTCRFVIVGHSARRLALRVGPNQGARGPASTQRRVTEPNRKDKPGATRRSAAVGVVNEFDNWPDVTSRPLGCFFSSPHSAVKDVGD